VDDTGHTRDEQALRLQPRTEGLTMRQVRKERELSLRDVERATGISRGILSRVERGVEVASPGLLVELSGVYGVDPGSWSLSVEWRLGRQQI